MTDFIDVLSSDGLRTGEILSREDIHRLGKHHRAVHLYLFNSQNEIFLQKRALTVDHFPGYFSISLTGHVKAGEFSSACVRRELEEELGIDASQLRFDFLFSFFQEAVLNERYVDRQFNDVYITHIDLNLETIRFDSAEVAEVQFVSFAKFRQMLSDGRSELAPVYANEYQDVLYFLGELLNLGQ